MKEKRKLEDLVSVGPATLKDFSLLGIKTVHALAKQNAQVLYQKLCRLSKVKHDPCVEDIMSAAIAQALDPNLSEEKKHWAYWSLARKKRPTRCAWVSAANILYERYHDIEWGVPIHHDKIHFEFIILEGAQAGLSWETILKRRDAYREAFLNFDWKKVGLYDAKDIERLLKTTNIIRNRAKVKSAINNAQCFENIRKEFGSFDAYIWQFVNGATLEPKFKSINEIPAFSPESKILSDDLRRRGFSFVGPTIMYAYMQATGLINGHTIDCFRHKRAKKNSNNKCQY